MRLRVLALPPVTKYEVGTEQPFLLVIDRATLAEEEIERIGVTFDEDFRKAVGARSVLVFAYDVDMPDAVEATPELVARLETMSGPT
jgi:hypothetical protein